MTSYTLFGQSGGATIQADVTAYTLGVEFSVSTSGNTLTGIWWNSPAGAASLPDTIGLYAVSGASLVQSQAASWSGAAGSGWVRAAFSSPPSLTAATNYKAVVLNAGPGGNWYGKTAGYWSTGAGSAGITNGPLSAPNNAGASPSQDSFNAGGTITYPGSSPGDASNYWIDPEVTATVDFPATVTAALAPMALAGQGAAGIAASAASLAAAPMALTAGALTGGNVTATASLALAPMALAGQQARGGGAGSDRHHRWRR